MKAHPGTPYDCDAPGYSGGKPKTVWGSMVRGKSPARDETARSVMARNTGHFSFLPVVDEAERFLGLYRAEQWFDVDAPREKIADNFEPFSEAVVIGADASIIDFVQAADERPTRLVVSGDRVAGLVSLSDLQQLPVRAALFTLITRLEIAMAQRIEDEWDGDASTGWLALLRGL